MTAAPLALTPWMRRRDSEDGHRVTNLELFFDLVFVFCVTKLSHMLIAHFTPLGALQTLILTMAVWWTWICTGWVTNWLNPEKTPVRLLVIALMLVGLALAGSISNAFQGGGLIFAVTYVVISVGRTAAALYLMWGSHQQANFTRILCWFCFSALFWLAGGLSSGETQLALWMVAVFLDYFSAVVGFQVPFLGRSSTEDWTVSGEHMAERAGLFVIIALGESLLVSGETFAELKWNLTAHAALFFTFASSVAMWWTYFVANAEIGARSISTSSDPGRIARSAYSFIHVAIVSGIVLNAVADEFILSHPTGHYNGNAVLAATLGPAIFLVGNLFFNRVISGRIPVSHVAGIVALLALIPLSQALHLVPLWLASLTAVIQVIVALWAARENNFEREDKGRLAA